jgi:hypothetical protein
VQTTESGGPRGHDAGKKVTGRKRQVMVDDDGGGLVLEPQPAVVQDREAAPIVLRLSRRTFLFVTKAFADSGYTGDRPATAPSTEVEIVRKLPGQVGFAVHPRRWVVKAPLCLDQPEPPPLEGPGGDTRLRPGLPLRSVRHHPCQTSCASSHLTKRGASPAKATRFPSGSLTMNVRAPQGSVRRVWWNAMPAA